MKQLTTILMPVALTGLLVISAHAQQPYRGSDTQARRLANRISSRAHAFKNDLSRALDASVINGTAREDEMNSWAADFERSADEFKRNVNNRRATKTEALELLRQAQVMDTFMRNNRLAYRAENRWGLLHSDLNRLARDFDIAWRWDTVDNPVWPYSRTEAQMRNLINRIETKTDRFSKDMPPALDRSALNSTAREDEINRMVTDFEYATDQLRQRFDNHNSTPTDMENVLQRGAIINDVMEHNRLGFGVENDWQSLKGDLNDLAAAYNVAWNWNRTQPPIQVGNWRWTGTYRLNQSRSDNPNTIADQAIRNNSSANRSQIYNNLVTRLRPPEMIALDRNGNQIVLASTKSPRVTLDVNGREYIERYPQGRVSRVKATFTGDRLTIVSNGDRPNDFTATFQPLDNGARLLVTRQLYAEKLSRPVVVQSYYDRTSNIADFNVFDRRYGDLSNNTFFIPDGSRVVAVLNDSLNTSTAVDNQRFTMTVREPSQYRGAVIEGYLSAVDRGGRLTGRPSMTLNFDRIRMPNGQTYNFPGVLQNVVASNGEDVRIDNEGAIAEHDSQTGTTIERTAIGSAVGALIGALAGGGKGAAIGAAVGAGAGAGSVFIQGRDNLDIPRGSEVTIHASAPRRY